MSKFTLFHFVSLNAKAGICNKNFLLSGIKWVDKWQDRYKTPPFDSQTGHDSSCAGLAGPANSLCTCHLQSSHHLLPSLLVA